MKYFDLFPFGGVGVNFVLSVIYKKAASCLAFAEKEEVVISSGENSSITMAELKVTIKVCCVDGIASVEVINKKKRQQNKVQIDVFTAVDVNDESPLFIYITRTTSGAIKVPLLQDCTIHVGRSMESLEVGSENAIIIDLPFVSSKHFVLIRENGKTSVRDTQSRNGLYFNGQQIQSAQINNNDVLTIVTVKMTLLDDVLLIENANGFLTLHNFLEPDTRQAAPLKYGTAKENLYQRSPRLLTHIESKIINIEKPPQLGGTPQINWLNVLVMPLASVILMVIMVATMGMSPVMLIMSGAMSVLSAIVAIANYSRQKKRYGQKGDMVEIKYRAYLATTSEELKRAKQLQLAVLCEANPTVSECLSMAQNRDKRLWDRRPADADFMFVRVGRGEIGAAVLAKYQQDQVIIEETQLEREAKLIAQESVCIPDAPILCNLIEDSRVGIAGEYISCLRLVRNMIIGLTTTHSYDEVKIIILANEGEEETWAWARWLPHTMNDAQTVRYIYSTKDMAEEALDGIAEEILVRKAEQKNQHKKSHADYLPHYVFVIANESILPNGIRKHLVGNQVGYSVLFLAKSLSALPAECEQIIEAADGNGVMYKKQNCTNTVRFEIEQSLASDAELFARSLAPLRVETEKGSMSLPNSISFLQGYGVKSPEQLKIGERWASAQTYKSLSVPIAALSNQGIFHFDVHQKAHGVHGIVAGTTGSGKTEMVQTWLLSLAVNYSPEDVNFVLIDFKGTGLMGPFVGLPHVAGTISNLDQNIDRNLLSIQNEIKRREELVAKYNNQGIKNVNDLNKAYAAGKATERIPILFVVIDEYAEFKKNYPDFGKEIDSLTATGLALGVFVVLMTQKPAGVVSAKTEDNIRFRWCLRVANPTASREMLGNADAAKINVPGRAYIKVGADGEVYEQVQSFWSGAPYIPDRETDNAKSSVISMVQLDGKRTPCEKFEKVVVEKSQGLEISAVVQHIIDYCKEYNVPRAEEVWTECLPERIGLDRLQANFDGTAWPKSTHCNPVIGLVDDPANQRQYPLALDLAEVGHTIVYGAPVTGKTTLLKSFVMSVAMTREPNEASIYIMDFGGWNLNVLKFLPHVGGIANDNDAERQKKLVMLIERILGQRKTMFADAGVGNANSYRDATGQTLTDVILVVDNFGAVLKTYPEFEQFFLTLTSTGANYGVYLVATANSPTAVSFKISQQIKNTIALQQVDKTSYTSLVGKPTGMLPAIVGRGYIKGTPPLEFHTALPASGDTDKEITEKIRIIAECMDRAWSGNRPIPIPEMPETIAFGSVKANNGVVLGLSTNEVMPVAYDFNKQHYLSISGLSSSGKSNLLQVIARQMKETLSGTVYCLDAVGDCSQAMRQVVDQYISGASNIDTFIEGFRPEMQSRYAAKQNDPAATFPPVIIVIDEFTQFFKAVSNDTISRLLAIIKLGSGLGLYLTAAADAYELSSLVNKGEPVSTAMAKAKQAVMLGGSMNDHNGIPVKATYAEKNVEVKEFEGYFVSNGSYTCFKAMLGE